MEHKTEQASKKENVSTQQQSENGQILPESPLDFLSFSGGSFTNDKIMNLQRTVGNHETNRILQRESDSHGQGCKCSICARMQRTPDTVQRAGEVDNTSLPSVKDSINKFEGMAPAPVTGTHDSVQVKGGPQTAAEVRAKVASGSPGSGAAAFLAQRVQELQGLGLSSEVGSQADLIPVLAADMKRKNSLKPIDEQEQKTDEQWETAARGQIEGNQTTALTTSDDRYTAITGGAKFDELHEFIHICSAQGGDSDLLKFQLQFNEGAINYFSEAVAGILGITVEARYPTETAIVKSMMALTGDAGIGALFNAVFKGDIAGFFNEVGKAYVALGNNKPDGKSKAFSEKGWDNDTAAREFESKTQAWNLGWLKPRLP